MITGCGADSACRGSYPRHPKERLEVWLGVGISGTVNWRRSISATTPGQ
jgi:hypothetical protein